MNEQEFPGNQMELFGELGSPDFGARAQSPEYPDGSELGENKVVDRSRKRAVESEDVDEFGLQEVDSDSKQFRVQVKAIFLTYSQVGETKESDLCHALLGRFNDRGVKCLECATERHRDGSRHFHIFLMLDKRLDSRDPKVFDFGDLHPNIKKVTKKVGSLKKIYHYLSKEGQEPTSYAKQFDMWDSSDRFVQKKSDWDAWLDFKKKKKILEPEFPRVGPHGFVINAPTDLERKRHLWVHGPPGCGKTTWFEREFGATKYFKVNANGRYPFDGYEGQRVILYDDAWPGKFHLTTLCNPRKQRQHVPGDTRYCERFLYEDRALLVIVLYNQSIDDVVEESDREVYHTRFREFYCANQLAFVLNIAQNNVNRDDE